MLLTRLLPGLLLVGAIDMLPAGQPKPETVQAFDAYVARREAALNTQAADPAHFLWAYQSPTRLSQARQGQVPVEPRNPGGLLEVPGGAIHDWTGSIFLPHTTLDQVLAFVQNYDHHQDYYKPEVVRSRLISRQGDTFQIHLRLLKKKIITVVYDTDHTVVYSRLSPTRARSRSVMTRSQVVDNPGQPDERPLPPEKDHGFLWRMNSYWRFEARDGGVWVECEAITLSRGVPTGVGWLVNPIVRELPRQSLTMTLANLQRALAR
jgi:hypothetical protein